MSDPAEGPTAPRGPQERAAMPPMCFACGRHITPGSVRCPDCGAPIPNARGRRGFDRVAFAAGVLGLLALVGGWGGVSFLMSTDEVPAAGNPILQDTVTFTGSVFNESAAALPGVQVFLGANASADPGNATHTNANGTFTLAQIRSGYHVITFERANYTTVQLRVYLLGDDTGRVTMAPGNGTQTQDHGTYRMMILGLNFCGSVVLGAALLAFAGALACYRRRNYGLALAASIVAILVVPVMPLAIVLWLLGLVLVVRSKRDFR